MGRTGRFPSLAVLRLPTLSLPLWTANQNRILPLLSVECRGEAIWGTRNSACCQDEDELELNCVRVDPD